MIEAANEQTLLERLEEKGLYCMYYKEKLMSRYENKRQIKSEILSIFFKQLASMLEGGILVDQSIELLLEEWKDAYMHKQLSAIDYHLKSGCTLAKAFENCGNAFPKLVIYILRCGEESGTLPHLTQHLADYYDKKDTIKAQLVSALMYPLLLSIVSFSIIVGMLIWVVPSFIAGFDGQVELSLPTRIVMGASDFFINTPIAMFGLIGLVIGVAIYVLRLERIKKAVCQLYFVLPGISKFSKLYAGMHYTKMMGLLYKAGMPLLAILTFSGEVIKNAYTEPFLEAITHEVMQGKSLSKAYEDKPIFPPMFLAAIRVGEETGKLDQMLAVMTAQYERELVNQLKRITTVIQPLLVVMIGMIIGVIIIGIFAPMYQLTGVIGG